MSTRSIWKGSISFGLVNIPVKLYTTSDTSKDFSFNQLDDKGHRIHYKKWCAVEDREVLYSEIRKGYQISKDNYVVIEKEDLDKIKMKTTQSIDIKEFIDSEDFDPLLIEKSYYVGPEKNKKSGAIDKAYTLFAKVINETNKIAIGKVVLKDREHLVALRSYQRGLVMHQLRYIDELKPVNEVEGMDGAASQQPQIDNKELSLGKTLVENLSSKQFDISQYSDEYAKQLEKIINAKVTGKQTVNVTEDGKGEGEEVNKNLLEALKASLKQKAKPKHLPSVERG
jgi:DNA end-binding protein Ku